MEAAYQEKRRKEKELEAKSRESALLDQYYRLAEELAEVAEDARLQHRGEDEESRSERLELFPSLKQTILSTARKASMGTAASLRAYESNI
jgi:hypothetical protein